MAARVTHTEQSQSKPLAEGKVEDAGSKAAKDSNSPRHGLQKGLINMKQARGRQTGRPGRKAGATGHHTQKPTQENCRVYLWHKMLRHNQRPTLAGNNSNGNSNSNNWQQGEQIVGWNCCISTRASLLIAWSALIQVMHGLGLGPGLGQPTVASPMAG